jgi:peptide/nickel transport system permease protein
VMSWPGLGPLLLDAILARDIYVIIGAVMMASLFLIEGMLLGDILLFMADPRIRTEGLV